MMKRRLVRSSLVGACAALALTCQSSQGAEVGPYINLDAGINFAQDIDATISAGGASAVGEAEFDPGFRTGIAAGYHFNPLVAAEIETGFLYNGFKDTDSWFGHVPFLANIIFKFDNESGIIPFIGGGAGGVASILEIEEVDTDTDVVFAWQGIAGVRFAINENMSVGATYKYLGTAESEFDIGGVSIEQDNSQNHAILASFNFRF